MKCHLTNFFVLNLIFIYFFFIFCDLIFIIIDFNYYQVYKKKQKGKRFFGDLIEFENIFVNKIFSKNTFFILVFYSSEALRSSIKRLDRTLYEGFF